jgi:hypothetical protein
MKEIQKLPELAFEENTHTYTVNGIEIPSVTTVMKQLNEDYYGGIDTGVLTKAAAKGTAVHNAIENFLKFGIDDIAAEFNGYYRAFKSFMYDFKPEVIGSENRIYHKMLRYAGTSDLALIVKNKLLCVDAKTSSSIVKMLTRVQLEAYARAFSSHGIEFAGKAVLHLKKNGQYSFDDRYEPKDTEAWDVFCSMLTVRNYLENNRR